mmetsp:Transcript_114703/g.263293  ORF Transcript_114703/g.263293 Transcript_114703/m.263293 type:complete len:231 (-) Transcript_114703:142-834(-)
MGIQQLPTTPRSIALGACFLFLFYAPMLSCSRNLKTKKARQLIGDDFDDWYIDCVPLTPDCEQNAETESLIRCAFFDNEYEYVDTEDAMAEEFCPYDGWDDYASDVIGCTDKYECDKYCDGIEEYFDCLISSFQDAYDCDRYDVESYRSNVCEDPTTASSTTASPTAAPTLSPSSTSGDDEEAQDDGGETAETTSDGTKSVKPTLLLPPLLGFFSTVVLAAVAATTAVLI